MYTFKRAEALGMLHSEMCERMGTEELHSWIAYDLLQDEDYRKKITTEVELERQQALSAEQRAELMRNMFAGLSGK